MASLRDIPRLFSSASSGLCQASVSGVSDQEWMHSPRQVWGPDLATRSHMCEHLSSVWGRALSTDHVTSSHSPGR